MRTHKKITRDPEKTRARILDAATKAFAEAGFSGATVEAIAEAAEVNMRMIYHYFGDKAGLYVSVLEELLGALRRAELQHTRAEGREPARSAIDGLLSMFDMVYAHFGANPDLVRILATENIMSARFLKSSVATQKIASPSLQHISALLARGLEDGSVRRKVDPLHLYVAMVGLALFHQSNGHTLSHIWSTDVYAPDWQAEHHRVGREMLKSYLDCASQNPRG